MQNRSHYLTCAFLAFIALCSAPPTHAASKFCNQILAGDDLSHLSPIERNKVLGTRPFVKPFPLPHGFSAAPAFAKPSAPTSLSQIQDLSQFRSLAIPVRTGLGEQHTLKIVYHRNLNNPAQNHIHFIDTHQFQYHHDFVQGVLGNQDSIESFNRNYEGDGRERRFNLASLTLSIGTGPNSTDQFLLELWGDDPLAGDYLIELYQAVKKHLNPKFQLRFHPLSTLQETIAQAVAQKILIVTNEELLKGRTFISMNDGVAYGYIKFVDVDNTDADKPSSANLDLTSIAVFDRVPNDIGLVGGVVTEQFQTPLSHINVKSINRGTANMYLNGAKNILRQYENRPVELRVTASGYQIRELNVNEADRLINEFWASRRPHLKSKLESISDPSQLNALTNLAGYYQSLPTRRQHSQLVKTVGAKAANLALIHFIVSHYVQDAGPIRSPEAFGTPFGFYDHFMQFPQTIDHRVTTLEQEIRRLLDSGRLLDAGKIHRTEVAAPILQKIRDTIASVKLPPIFLELLKRQIMDDPNSPIH